MNDMQYVKHKIKEIERVVNYNADALTYNANLSSKEMRKLKSLTREVKFLKLLVYGLVAEKVYGHFKKQKLRKSPKNFGDDFEQFAGDTEKVAENG